MKGGVERRGVLSVPDSESFAALGHMHDGATSFIVPIIFCTRCNEYLSSLTVSRNIQGHLRHRFASKMHRNAFH